jgi:hypothetical protein
LYHGCTAPEIPYRLAALGGALLLALAEQGRPPDQRVTEALARDLVA